MILPLFLLASNLWAADAKLDKIAYAKYSDPTVSFDYPAGWKVEARGMRDYAGQCRIAIYLNHVWFKPLETSGWAHIQFEFVNMRQRVKVLKDNDIHEQLPVRDVDDYRHMFACEPPFPAKMMLHYPPGFSTDNCATYLAPFKLAAARTAGSLYHMKFNRASSNPAFNAALREASVVFSPPGDKTWVYRADYYAPVAEFEKYRPAFEHLLATAVLTPNGAPMCGDAPAPNPSAPPASPSPAPAESDKAVPMLR